MSDYPAENFRLVTVEFAGLVSPAATFAFGAGPAGGSYEIALERGAANLEEAIAVAAESAAADLRAWAQEAEDFAAAARAGGLLQAPATP